MGFHRAPSWAQCFLNIFINHLDAGLEEILCLVVILNWEELLILLRAERTCRVILKN